MISDKNTYMRNYYKKNPWKRILTNIKSRCNNKLVPKYKTYGAKGIKCLITSEEIKRLWFRDKAYLMKKPSIDRENSKGNYEYSNCRFIKLGLNSALANNIAVDQLNYLKKVIKSYPSMSIAARELQGDFSLLARAIRKGYKHKGFYWRKTNGI